MVGVARKVASLQTGYHVSNRDRSSDWPIQECTAVQQCAWFAAEKSELHRTDSSRRSDVGRDGNI